MAMVTAISKRTDIEAVGELGLTLSTSAAQIARIKWKNGNQRKLHRKRPAVGSMQSKSTSKSKISSHLRRRMSKHGRHRNPATSAAGATKPQASSMAVCGIRREEKPIQLTVQPGTINPGRARQGTIHCQCAAAGCDSRAEP